MEDSARTVRSNCLAGLAGALLVLALCHAQRGAGILLPQSWDDSEAALSVSPVGGLVGEHRTASAEQANFVAEEQVEDKRGGSWLEQEEVEQVPSEADNQTETETPTQPPTRFGRLLARLRWRGRRRGGSAGEEEEGQPRRVPLRTRLLQHWRRGVRFFRHDIPAAAALLYRRLRPVQPRPVFTDEEPEDVKTNPLYFHGSERGDIILHKALESIPGIQNQVGTRLDVAVDDMVSQKLWAEGQVVTLASELGQPDRQLVRGPRIDAVSGIIVFEATDVATQEKIGVKVGTTSEKPSRRVIAKLKNEALCTGLFAKVRNPIHAQRLLRFLVAADLMKIPGKPISQEASSDYERRWVLNYLLPVPQTQARIEYLISACQGSSEQRHLLFNVRLQISVQAIRLVGILQDQGVVHGMITPDAFSVKNGGSVHLGEFDSLVKAGTKAEPMTNWYFAAPEARVVRRVLFLGLPKVRYTHAMDAWSLGATLFWIWCGNYPHTGEGSTYSIEYLFQTCRRVPEPVKTLIYMFLNPSPTQRLLALQAMDTPQFQEIGEMISSALRQYDQPGEPQL
ncbi:unnamed protein product [Neospora caninum Liverpool]|uniref:Rhoptry protein ROP7, related n=1 Tax=Neospora caninum (strain Liverpool) TaxID=572307 RepID=F0V7L6_NEOCL|nr:uncharacterized protein NCLIV_001950 [Neospora caninum Liverpool]CBZ49707.1 unnamed protein product [Neospora caninum Liverpool]CEL64292.1 TPA: Rhoptry protein ROP7, related [Neospora caninum Liverpool]|eukprot:XP_003879742.1 uncharacterized protein NCLIV_001950 [Neospora caninum Liverpool]